MVKSYERPIVAVRGAGDIATGVIVRLIKAGFDVIALEIEKPSVIRRTVSFAEAIFSGSILLEGITARSASDLNEATAIMGKCCVPVLTDPKAESTDELKKRYGDRYVCFVDATISKRNIGTSMDMAGIVIGIGPGFCAGEDCHCVVESMRGHYLGKPIFEGRAIPNTGIPGKVGGESLKRLIRSPATGKVINVSSIGDEVKSGDLVQLIHEKDGNYYQAKAEINGTVRGMIVDGFIADKGLKIADIDPRCDPAHCYSVSDKAMSIGGGVLVALLELHGGVTSF